MKTLQTLVLILSVCLCNMSFGLQVTVQQLTFATIGLPALPDPAGAPYVSQPNPAWTVWQEIETHPDPWWVQRTVLYLNDGSQTMRIAENNWWSDTLSSTGFAWEIGENSLVYGTFTAESSYTQNLSVYSNGVSTLWLDSRQDTNDWYTLENLIWFAPGCIFSKNNGMNPIEPSIFWLGTLDKTLSTEFSFECRPAQDPGFVFESFPFEPNWNSFEIFENGIRFRTDVYYVFPEDVGFGYEKEGYETFWMPIPEPATVGLMLLGGLAAVRRKKYERREQCET